MSALATLKTDGVCVVRQAVPLTMIDDAVQAVKRFKQVNRNWLEERKLLVHDHFSRVINLHLLLPSLRSMFCALSAEAAECADAIGRASLYTSLYFEHGSEQDLHRDTPYFWTDPPYAYAGLWVALEDADEENGALIAVPGSHLIGEPDLVAIRQAILGDAESPPSHNGLFEAYNRRVRELAKDRGLRQVSLPVRKGDVIVWNASTLHGGMAHRNSGRSRHSFVMHVTPPGVSVNHMHYFFHPERPVPKNAPWTYLTEGGRDFALHRNVSFMHRFDPALEDFDSDLVLKDRP